MNKTSSNSKQPAGRLFMTSIKCVATASTSAILFNIVLISLILLLTRDVSAEEDFTGDYIETITFQNPADAGTGALLFKNDGQYINAPALHTDVNMKISGMIARVKVTQQFNNSTSDWQEGLYVFPLPEQSAVDHMRLIICERIIEGMIQEKNQAKKTYQQARDSGRKASLVEQERPNIFTTSVANIAPGESIEVEIEYQQIIHFDSGVFRLRFPMVVGPRYIPGNTVVKGFDGTGWASNTEQVTDAARITPPVMTPDSKRHNSVNLHIDLDAGLPLDEVNSTYHSIIKSEQTEHRYSIDLENIAVTTDRDFELVWQARAHHLPQAALFTGKKENEVYSLIMIIPPARDQKQALNREVVFVIDTSGSMAGASIAQARAALELALIRLNPGDYFNVIQFNSRYDKLFRQSQAVSENSINKALHYVRSLTARGGTEMAPALLEALTLNAVSNTLRQVIFLTDGSVGNESALFEIIKSNLANSRLFTIGIGSAPNSHFMNRAARFGRGTYTYIGKVEEVQNKMADLFNKLENPVLGNIQLDWSGNELIETWPQKIPDLYLGEPLLITSKSASLPEQITIMGEIATQQWSSTLKLHGGQLHEGIPVLWARNKIEALMDHVHSENSNSVRQEITETALNHHLVSKYTSLVAVDVTPSRPVTEPLDKKSIPTHLPKGWQFEKVFGNQYPQTATPADLYLLLGFLMLFLTFILYLTRKPDYVV